MKIDFIRTKFSSLDGQTKVSFAVSGDSPDPFTLTAAPDGVTFQGVYHIADQEELQAFAQFLDRVWRERLNLQPKFVLTPSGH